MKVASLTVDDVVKLRVALNNAENALKKLASENNNWQVIYNGELQQVKEAKEALAASMRREP
jgi:phosphotransferase system IIB component